MDVAVKKAIFVQIGKAFEHGRKQFFDFIGSQGALGENLSQVFFGEVGDYEKEGRVVDCGASPIEHAKKIRRVELRQGSPAGELMIRVEKIRGKNLDHRLGRFGTGDFGQVDAAMIGISQPLPQRQPRVEHAAFPGSAYLCNIHGLPLVKNILAESYCLRRLGSSQCSKSKVKNRTVAELAADSDGAAVEFDDGFGDGQAHAGALHARAQIASTIEFFEDHVQFHVVDACAVVGHAGHDFPAQAQFGHHVNGSVGGRIFSGIFQEMDKNLDDAVNIHVDERQVVGNFHFDGMTLKDESRGLNCRVDGLADR